LDPISIKPRGAPCKKRPKAFHERFNSRYNCNCVHYGMNTTLSINLFHGVLIPMSPCYLYVIVYTICLDSEFAELVDLMWILLVILHSSVSCILMLGLGCSFDHMTGARGSFLCSFMFIF
jgi:hypothetical protein